MTDMHREGFERFCRDSGFSLMPSGDEVDNFLHHETEYAYMGWCAALRYRDEQEKQA
jgi:hypothetical protein